jgi:uncharacterized protein
MWATVALSGAALMVGIPIALRSYWAEAQVYADQRRPIPLPQRVDFEVAAISVPQRGLIRGWYWPAHNGAAVVMLHGSSSDRRSCLREANALSIAGFGVLAYDAPGHGESEGIVSWEDADRDALRAAVSWVASKPGVERIGVLGQSAGGVIATQVSAREPAVSALALIGTPSDLRALVHHEYRRWGWLSIGPALLALKRHGARLDVDRPVDLVTHFDRPLLIVGGTADTVVTPEMTQALRVAAGPRVQGLEITASHGNWAEEGGAQYLAGLTAFFFDSLHVLPP